MCGKIRKFACCNTFRTGLRNWYLKLVLPHFKKDVNELEMKGGNPDILGRVGRNGLFDLEREAFGVKMGEIILQKNQSTPHKKACLRPWVFCRESWLKRPRA